EAALDAEGHQRAAAAVEILLGEPVVWAFRERGVVDPRDAAMVAEEFRDAPAILDVALDAKRERLDALQQEERAQRREHGAGRPLIDAAAASDVRCVLEMVHVDETVIRGVRLREDRETLYVLPPREPAAVHDDPA